ncbi:NAD(+)/NADH kinase [Candidatus Saccharibacteria bacterium]|jgi:NAD+ kinase|nr:NAD(+)/NADH kinase [Candidatus Saccharibacteria bacterium]MBP7017886.1 NAD(+)/NADH kinase [Candidatus Saccharibacteria bacterium]MBP9131802.1 NAD(+)/NADH kinase [Candidatus Saccharibacteria bacterium]
MKRAHIFFRYETDEIAKTVSKIKAWADGRLELVEDNPDLVVVIGGDGAMMEAARKFQACGAEILGVNRGTVGFLASIDRKQDIEEALEDVIKGRYTVIERTLLDATVNRGGEAIFQTVALNDVVISSPLSVVALNIAIDDKPYLTMRGTGVLVSTPTGSTAYNLSAHGPILTPSVPALIVTELLDHSVPTPSLIVAEDQKVTVVVDEFRNHGQLKLSSGEPADVVLDADGSDLFSLQKNDQIVITKSEQCTKFIEFEQYDFFSHLREKFEIS